MRHHQDLELGEHDPSSHLQILLSEIKLHGEMILALSDEHSSPLRQFLQSSTEKEAVILLIPLVNGH